MTKCTLLDCGGSVTRTGIFFTRSGWMLLDCPPPCFRDLPHEEQRRWSPKSKQFGRGGLQNFCSNYFLFVHFFLWEIDNVFICPLWAFQVPPLIHSVRAHIIYSTDSATSIFEINWLRDKLRSVTAPLNLFT